MSPGCDLSLRSISLLSLLFPLSTHPSLSVFLSLSLSLYIYISSHPLSHLSSLIPSSIRKSIKSKAHKNRLRQTVTWARESDFIFHRVITKTVFSILEGTTTVADKMGTLASLLTRSTISCLWTQGARAKPQVNDAIKRYRKSFPGLEEALKDVQHRNEPGFFKGSKTCKLVKSVAQSNATRFLVNCSNLKHGTTGCFVGMLSHILQTHAKTARSFLLSSSSLFSDLSRPRNMSKKTQTAIDRFKKSRQLVWLINAGVRVSTLTRDQAVNEIMDLLAAVRPSIHSFIHSSTHPWIASELSYRFYMFVTG